MCVPAAASGAQPKADSIEVLRAGSPPRKRPQEQLLRPQEEVASAHQLLQIGLRRLQFLGSDKALPDRQLWGAHFGTFN